MTDTLGNSVCSTEGCGGSPPAGEHLCLLCGLREQLRGEIDKRKTAEERVAELERKLYAEARG